MEVVMCGRFARTADVEEIQQAFAVTVIESKPAISYNVAPTQPVAVVVQYEGQNVLTQMVWGLIPVWAKEVSIGAKMINARAETLAEKASFKRPLKHQRCLVVANGFYEWQKVGAQKTPLYIQLKSDEPFGLAGLYDRWTSPEGLTITSCAIITTTPNKMMEPIHDRMPVILPPNKYATWLDPTNQNLEALTKLLQPYPATKMKAYAVSTLVNSPRNNTRECITPV
jgi:putative SOS response-associated peptidase YedK